jgi:hypothetical protein
VVGNPDNGLALVGRLVRQIGVHPIYQRDNMAAAQVQVRLGSTTAMSMNATVMLPPSANEFQIQGACE